MNSDWQSLLKPEILAEVEGLELISRVIVEGFLSGIHGSNKTGVGLEFSQYRSYQPGDDLRLLDWKMFARSNRYYIRQSDIDTNVVVKLIMDSSKSMLYEEAGITKWHIGSVLAAALAYLANIQGDDLALFSLNDKNETYLAPSNQKNRLQKLLQRLINIEVQGKWPAHPPELYHSSSKKEVIIFFSDFYETNHELTNAISQFKTTRNEVLVCYIIGRREDELNYQGNVTFQDLETNRRIETSAASVRDQYKQNLKAHQKAVESVLQENGITWMPFYMDENPGAILNAFLKQRNKLLV